MSAFTFTAPTDHAPGAWHGAYIPVYERLFSHLKETLHPVMEIGCDGGGFTLALASYFRRSEIITVDISPMPPSLKGAERVTHLQRDAYDNLPTGDLRFAVLIDDGPHTIESQRHFVSTFPKKLIHDGIAVVEDVQDIAHFSELSKCVPEGFFGFGIDLRMHDDRYDNLLFVIQRA